MLMAPVETQGEISQVGMVDLGSTKTFDARHLGVDEIGLLQSTTSTTLTMRVNTLA